MSLSPHWRRRWCSLYAAFREGVIHRARRQATFAAPVPLPSAGQRWVLGVDVSPVARPESPTARDRTYQDVHNLPDCAAPVTVFRVIRQGATGQKRDPRVSWFIWVGEPLLPLSEIWPTDRRRSRPEHGFRFEKQDLLWTAPRLRTPEQFQPI